MLEKKICVVGCGNWGKKHILSLNKMLCLGGLVDSNLKVKEQMKDAYPNTPFFSDLDEAIK